MTELTTEPRYVLKTVEACLVPVNQTMTMRFIKKGLALVFVLLAAGSILFGDNLFMGMTTLSKVLLLGLVVYVFRAGGFRTEWQAFPMELRFYDDHMVVYRPRHYYDRRLSRKLIYKIQYKDITKCVYESCSGRIFIHGDMHSTWYKLNKDGSVPETPGFDQFVTKTSLYFESRLEKETDIRQVIEAWTGQKFIVENRF